MIVCSSCLHQNLDEAAYCENCGTKLPAMSSCSNCGSPVQTNAHFCGQCGFNLKLASYQRVESATAQTRILEQDSVLPEPFPLVPIAELLVPEESIVQAAASGATDVSPPPPYDVAETTAPPAKDTSSDEAPNTQIQTQSAALFHVQSNTLIELSEGKPTVYIGKPNDRVPPDINVSVFSSAEVVSRVHAAIHIERGHLFIEDVGSANGTYLNNMPLTPNTRYRLRVGDRISLGKGELVSFVFKMN